MRTVFLLSFITFLFCIVSLPSYAANVSGSYLYQMCDKDEKGGERVKGGHVACQSYISGVIDYHNVLQSMKIAPKIDVCIPANATLNDLHDIVLRYLRKHGEHDNFVAAPAVTMAIYEVYPCK